MRFNTLSCGLRISINSLYIVGWMKGKLWYLSLHTAWCFSDKYYYHPTVDLTVCGTVLLCGWKPACLSLSLSPCSNSSLHHMSHSLNVWTWAKRKWSQKKNSLFGKRDLMSFNTFFHASSVFWTHVMIQFRVNFFPLTWTGLKIIILPCAMRY